MLYDLIQPHTSLSTVGMCKNAGKTTVLNRLIAECGERGECIALTSIGRDGERSDVVTNTKKPEIFVLSSTLVATAADALALGDVSREILGTTGMPTPMGEVVIIRAMSDGLVQIAGPSMTAQLRELKKQLIGLGAERVFIDGALSRRSLAMPALSDAAILCTGASYSRDMKKTAQDTAFAVRLMGLPEAGEPGYAAHTEAGGGEKFTFVRGGEPVSFALAEDAAEHIRKNGAGDLLIRGGVTDAVLEAFFRAGRALEGVRFIAEDASRLLVSQRNFEKLLRCGAEAAVVTGTRLVAVTVNPFSAYGESYDKDLFFSEVRRLIPEGIPVINVINA